MTSPLRLARASALAALTEGARRLGSAALPAEKALRFRPDGKGGELASPFPMAAGLDSAALAAAVPPAQWIEGCHPSQGWIALELSEDWRTLVRNFVPEPLILTFQTPPIPDFPARIDEKSWRFCALLDQTAPLVCARRDRSNPAVRLALAQARAGQNRGQNRPDRYLVNLCAAALDCAAPAPLARRLLELAEGYLKTPGEDALVNKTLCWGAQCLGI